MKLKASVFLLTILSISPSVLYGCSCVPTNSCSLIKAGETVFVGTVLSTEAPGYRFPDGKLSYSPLKTVRFTVEESFRGVEGNEVEVSTNEAGGTCGYPFQVGHSYLVFAAQHQGKLLTGLCSSTRPAVAAAALIQQLRIVKAGKTPASVFGRVSGSPGFLAIDGREKAKSIAGVEIKLKGKRGDEFTAVASDVGMYEFHDLPPDQYEIRTLVPSGWKIRELPLPVNVDGLSSCERNFFAVSDAKN